MKLDRVVSDSKPYDGVPDSTRHTGRMSPVTKAEFETTREIYEFKVELLELMAEHFGGQSTLNHLRVGNFIGKSSQYYDRPTTNAEIASALRLSRATVSRIVNDFVGAGWVTEYAHPDDGRKRLLTITPGHPKGDQFERAFRRCLNVLLTQYSEGKIIHVDPKKRMF